MVAGKHDYSFKIHALPMGNMPGLIYPRVKLLMVERVLCHIRASGLMMATFDEKRVNCKRCLKKMGRKT